MHRRSAAGLTTYPLPLQSSVVRRLEVDANNHAWIVADSALWRMTSQVDFGLAAQPATWLLTPGDSQHGRMIVTSQEGFNADVTVQISGLPGTFTATVAPTVVKPGATVTITLTANADTPLGTYGATLIGVSNNITHTAPLTIAVVAEIFAAYLPLIAGQ